MHNNQIRLNSAQPSSFSPRILQIADSPDNFSSPCPTCDTDGDKGCAHYEKCSECTIYQIEKVLRCEDCCSKIIKSYPPFCSDNCNRKNFTQNVSAKCDICNGPLRKKCTSCKTNGAFQTAKKKLKLYIRIYVTAIESIVGAPKIRPCSHCRVCVRCNSTLTKGHRERAICSGCKALPNTKRKETDNDIQKTNSGNTNGKLTNSVSNYITNGILNGNSNDFNNYSNGLSNSIVPNGKSNVLSNGISNDLSNGVIHGKSNGIISNGNSLSNGQSHSLTNDRKNSLHTLLNTNKPNGLTNSELNGVSNDITNSILSNISQDKSNGISNGLSYGVAHGNSNGISNGLSNGISDPFGNKSVTTNGLSNGKSNGLLDRTTEDHEKQKLVGDKCDARSVKDNHGSLAYILNSNSNPRSETTPSSFKLPSLKRKLPDSCQNDTVPLKIQRTNQNYIESNNGISPHVAKSHSFIPWTPSRNM